MLDIDEHLHLALYASRKGDCRAAILHLKQLLDQEPGHAFATYLLAAQHAEIGLSERAIAGMQRALVLAPALDIARFQLGLLFLQDNRRQEAAAAFETLTGTAADAALGHFASAYGALLGDKREQAALLLRQGIAACSHNPALRSDMERVLAGLEKDAAEAASQDGGASSNLMLHAYRNTLEQ